MRPFQNLSRILLVLVVAANVGFADDETNGMMTEHNWVEVHDTANRWEFGAQLGEAIPIGNRSQTLRVSNQAFLTSDPDDPGEDEFAENGFPSPDFNASSDVSGNLHDSFSVGGHAFYNLTSWISPGIEGSAIIQHSLQLTQLPSTLQVPIYRIDYKARGGNACGVLRLGGWMGWFRPYGIVGAGPYFLDEQVTADLNDVDDPDHSPVIMGRSSNTYLMALWGGGVDINILGHGSLGLGLQYQRVFSPQHNIQFIVPTLRFDAQF